MGWGVWANAAGSGVDGASARESAGTKEPQAGRAAVSKSRTMSSRVPDLCVMGVLIDEFSE